MRDQRGRASGGTSSGRCRRARRTTSPTSPTSWRPSAGEQATIRLARRARGPGRVVDVLVEVDFTGERSGRRARMRSPPFADLVAGLEGVRLRGSDDPAADPPSAPRTPARGSRRLRELRDALARTHPQVVELSMGMSLDYAVAVEEGATMVRIGTALFGPTNSVTQGGSDGRRVEEDPQLPRTRRGRRGVRGARCPRPQPAAGPSHAPAGRPGGPRRHRGRRAHDRVAARSGGRDAGRSTSPSRSASTRRARSPTASRTGPRSS